MDYSKIMEALKQASLFDLYRLSVAISHQLDDPKRINEIKRHLKPGQIIDYFDGEKNRLIQAKVINLKRTRLLVEHLHNKERWTIPFYFINLEGVDTDIVASNSLGLEKNELKVGDIVGFQNEGKDIRGTIIRLNRKTVTLKTSEGAQWRVSYSFLYLIIDGEPANRNVIEGEIITK